MDFEEVKQSQSFKMTELRAPSAYGVYQILTRFVLCDFQLVLSTGTGVNGFTLDPSLGEFILTHPDIKVSSVLHYFFVEKLSMVMGPYV